MVFEIVEEVNIQTNGFLKKLKTRFMISFLLFNKTEDERIYIINKEKINNLPVQENEFLSIQEEFEALNFPIKIKTDYKGHFIGIHDHETWLAEWDLKAEEVIEMHEDPERARSVKNKYFDVIKDENFFTKNKFKQPSWNIFFFNPPIDNVNLPDLGTILNWNIQAIGTIPCVGRTAILNPESKEIIISFDSTQKLSHNIIENLKSKIKADIRWDEQRVKLHTESHFDTVEKKVKKKTAYFQFMIKDIISYTEDVTITLKN
ncbi:hypothetical protein FLGE108171_13275 [Flavobacterium gelidilacus]|uniref:hypothetical protein n=1 Tax=Flavobacterium gelidilacus TaxID=206041 RepID=UPI0004168335|nr:hypothetical protein [Flavobacterium gelidilacus]